MRKRYNEYPRLNVCHACGHAGSAHKGGWRRECYHCGCCVEGAPETKERKKGVKKKMARPVKEWQFKQNGKSLQVWREGKYVGSYPILGLYELVRIRPRIVRIGADPNE